MNATQLQSRLHQTLQRIAQLKPMRKGSVTEQTVATRAKDGQPAERGPYPLYTCKKKGRTRSKRIPRERVPLYREQIERFRRFQDLIAEYAEISEQLADAEAAPGGQKRGCRI